MCVEQIRIELPEQAFDFEQALKIPKGFGAHMRGDVVDGDPRHRPGLNSQQVYVVTALREPPEPALRVNVAADTEIGQC